MLFSQVVVESSFGSKHEITKETLVFLFDVLLFYVTTEVFPISKVLSALTAKIAAVY